MKKSAAAAVDPEYVSRVRYLPMAAKKVRRVAQLVRGLPADKALHILNNLPKRPARPLAKLILAALATAKATAAPQDLDKMKIKTLMIDGGPEKWNAKKWRPASMGRSARIRKRTSHVTLSLWAGKE